MLIERERGRIAEHFLWTIRDDLMPCLKVASAAASAANGSRPASSSTPTTAW
ncbi:MAG: hypothetical protein AAGB48_09290 [Planctomycetota bacterium]